MGKVQLVLERLAKGRCLLGKALAGDVHANGRANEGKPCMLGHRAWVTLGKEQEIAFVGPKLVEAIAKPWSCKNKLAKVLDYWALGLSPIKNHKLKTINNKDKYGKTIKNTKFK